MSVGTVKNENIWNKKLAKELQKPIIRKFEEIKAHLPFIDNVWGDDLAGMQLINKFNEGICFSLCVIDIFSQYACVILFKDKKSIAITNFFENFLKESNQKPN